MTTKFREELRVAKCTDKFGNKVWMDLYNYCMTKTNLADNTVQIIESGMEVDLIEVCKVIYFFSPHPDVRYNIKEFLDKDEITLTEEY